MKPFYESALSSLYAGDCVEVMRSLIDEGKRVDKVITSPPYNIIRPDAVDRGYDLYKDGMTNEQYIDWIVSIFELYDRIVNPNGCVMWNMSYGTENTECMSLCVADVIRRTNWTLADVIVWKKSGAWPNNVSPNKMTRVCEFVYVFCRRSEFNTFTSNKKIVGKMPHTGQNVYENVFNFISAENNDGFTELNRATFSTEFVNQLINRYVTLSDTVLDNFSGTGTTMVCCEKRNRKGIYIELSEKQCEYSVKRLKRGVQTNLFDFENQQ